MKITINLTNAEVKGIKAYLKEVDEIKRPKKSDVERFVNSYIDVINSPQEAVSDYIRAEINKETKPQPYNVGTIYAEL